MKTTNHKLLSFSWYDGGEPEVTLDPDLIVGSHPDSIKGGSHVGKLSSSTMIYWEIDTKCPIVRKSRLKLGTWDKKAMSRQDLRRENDMIVNVGELKIDYSQSDPTLMWLSFITPTNHNYFFIYNHCHPPLCLFWVHTYCKSHLAPTCVVSRWSSWHEF